MSNTFTVNGETYSLLTDDDLTWVEAGAIEKVSGVSMLDPDRKPTLAFTQAFFWVSMKRKQPDLKFSDLGDLPISAFMIENDEDGNAPSNADADPLEPAPDDSEAATSQA